VYELPASEVSVLSVKKVKSPFLTDLYPWDSPFIPKASMLSA
jgi:hypothetical protein